MDTFTANWSWTFTFDWPKIATTAKDELPNPPEEPYTGSPDFVRRLSAAQLYQDSFLAVSNAQHAIAAYEAGYADATAGKPKASIFLQITALLFSNNKEHT